MLSRLRGKAVLCYFIFCLLCAAGFAQTVELSAGDSLQADSLLPSFGMLALSADSTLPTGASQPWLLPLGMIAVTGAAIFLLFSVRSR